MDIQAKAELDIGTSEFANKGKIKNVLQMHNKLEGINFKKY